MKSITLSNAAVVVFDAHCAESVALGRLRRIAIGVQEKLGAVVDKVDLAMRRVFATIQALSTLALVLGVARIETRHGCRNQQHSK